MPARARLRADPLAVEAQREILARLAALERRNSVRLGRWVLTVDAVSGDLIATPDGGAPTVLAS